jgi:hypothetical protein
MIQLLWIEVDSVGGLLTIGTIGVVQAVVIACLAPLAVPLGRAVQYLRDDGLGGGQKRGNKSHL